MRQVRIDLDPQRLRALQLTPGDVSTALQRANADVPAGLLTGNREDAIVRVEGKVKDAKAVRRRRRRQPQRPGDPPFRPRHAGRARARARLDLARSTACRRSRSRSSSSRTPTSSRPARRSRTRRPSCARRLPPGVELRLVYADSDWVARSLSGVKKHADRRRAADGGDRLPVPAQLAQHDHHRPDAADRGDLGLHRGLRCSASRSTS